MAKCVRRSVLVQPPTHFLTLRPGPLVTASKAFARGRVKFLNALKRRLPNKRLEYLVVNEWRNGVPHAHALIRVGGSMPRRKMRRAVREAKGVAGLRVSVRPIRNVMGAANYIFKHTRRPERKAELTPQSFRGRMFTASKGFLTKPFDELWREVKETNRKLRAP